MIAISVSVRKYEKCEYFFLLSPQRKNVKLDAYNVRELGRLYKRKVPMRKMHLRNLGLQRERISKLDSPNGEFNWAAIILYSRPNRSFSF